jgi:hypothetical protein
MPSSDPIAIPQILALLGHANPNSVLDVGPGFGKWGVLAREYLETHGDDGRHIRSRRIDCVEIYAPYITDLHRAIYDNIVIGDVRTFLGINEYDLVLIIDVIEHLHRREGLRILEQVKAFIVATPACDYPQGAVFGNENERHVSRWYPADFPRSITVGRVLIGFNIPSLSTGRPIPR